MERVWIVPKNDAEAVTIINLLAERKEKFYVTNQAWGASWEGLEEKIQNVIDSKWIRYHLGAIKRPIIYGIELQGKAPNLLCENIDHHTYRSEDRSNKLSSLEQVAKILNIKLTLFEQFISVNDTDYIQGMLKLGKKLNLPQNEINKYISEVRALDRQAQEITEEQEEQVISALKNAEIYNDGKTYIIYSPHSKCACYTDRLFGKYKQLLVFSKDGEVNYFGKKAVIEELFNIFEGWKGGNIEENHGYWGGYPPKEEWGGIKAIVLMG